MVNCLCAPGCPLPLTLTPWEAAPILKESLGSGPSFLRSYFDATATSSLADFEREAVRHPVFEIM